MPERLESYYDNNIINYLESLADDQDAYHKIKNHTEKNYAKNIFIQ